MKIFIKLVLTNSLKYDIIISETIKEEGLICMKYFEYNLDIDKHHQRLIDNIINRLFASKEYPIICEKTDGIYNSLALLSHLCIKYDTHTVWQITGLHNSRLGNDGYHHKMCERIEWLYSKKGGDFFDLYDYNFIIKKFNEAMTWKNSSPYGFGVIFGKESPIAHHLTALYEKLYGVSECSPEKLETLNDHFRKVCEDALYAYRW